MEEQNKDALNRDHPRLFDQVGHQTMMHKLEICTFPLNNVIVRLTKDINSADKNWAHF